MYLLRSHPVEIVFNFLLVQHTRDAWITYTGQPVSRRIDTRCTSWPACLGNRCLDVSAWALPAHNWQGCNGAESLSTHSLQGACKPGSLDWAIQKFWAWPYAPGWRDRSRTRFGMIAFLFLNLILDLEEQGVLAWPLRLFAFELAWRLLWDSYLNQFLIRKSILSMTLAHVRRTLEKYRLN